MSAKDRVLLFSLLLLLAVNAGVSNVDGCANGFPDMNLITTKALKTNTGQPLESGLSLLNAFTCSGTLTGLVLGVDVRTETNSRNQYPEISLWMPRDIDDEDQHKYDFVEGSKRTVQLTPANFSTNGVFDYAIVPPLDFQANDILGWTQPGGNESVVRMYTIDGTEFMINRIIPESVSANSFSYEGDSDIYSDDVLLIYPVAVTASCNDQQFLSEETVRSKSLMISKVIKRDKTQRIFPDMHFTCTGLLTKWIIGGEPGEVNDPFPELQLWRASSESSYNKIGFSLIDSLPNATMDTNVYEYVLDTPLEFQEGDIFGVYKPKENESVLNIFLQENSGPFAYGKKKDAGMALTEIMVDPTEPLNQNDYPMVSVEISMISSTTSVLSSSMQTTTSSSYFEITSTLSSTTSVLSSSMQTTTSSSYFEITSTLSSSTSGLTSITESINNSAFSSDAKTTSTLASPTSMLSNSMQTTTTSSYIEMTTVSSSNSSFLSSITESMNNTTSSIDVNTSSTLGLTSPVQISSNPEAVSSPTTHSGLQIPSAVGTSSHIMGPATQTDETTRISPHPTGGTFQDEQEKEASVVIAIIVVLAVTALLVLLLVTMVIGIVILKVKRSKTFSPAHISEETFDENVNGGKTMVKSISCAKPVTKGAGFTNLDYEVDNGMDVLKNSSSDKLLRGVTSISNPIYEVEDSSFVPDVVYEDAECPVPDSIQNDAVLERSDLSSLQDVPTMAERQRFAQDEQHHDQAQTYSRLERQGFFVESEIYWNPGSESASIYEQLAQKKYREISRQQIKTICPLGSGQFGQVSKGLWYSPAGPKEVAIKVLQDQAGEKKKVKFLQEAAIMGQFHHPNVITLHGVVTVGEPAMIILELMEKGDLREHLHSFRPAPGEILSSSEDPILLVFCRQVASGMDYLSKKSFVHRDLAARNILVSSKGHCKIADFGMSRDLMDDDYYKSSGGQIPIKWTAPEALLYKKYSTASDVWSFGVLMYEVWSLGHKPFESMTNQEAHRFLDDGNRLPPPPGCPRAIYELMIQCWHPEMASRPTFSHLHSVLSHPDKGLLVWSDEDRNCHPQASVLGAPLEAGTHLYPRLQETYMCMNS